MGEPKHILIVDDEPNNLVVLKALVTSLGYECELAHDGSEALARLSPRIDLVLLDVMMPGMDGFEAARRIRGDSDCRDIPIIMVTALTSKEDRLRAVEAGANDFISKPIDRVELRVRMASLLKMKEAQDAIKQHRASLEIEVERRTAELLRTSQERAFIRETFGTYLSDEVVTEILQSPNGVNLGGELRDVTILVSDLRGFTSITESMDCRQVLETINRYLERMTEIIMRRGGTIDEFMGDGILAFFGAPRVFPDHPRRAVACALEMQQAMGDLNRENILLGLPELRMGIGINCGELIVGNIGSEKRKKYGAVGTPINVAFRVQARADGGEILVTPPVYESLAHDLEIGWTKDHQLKGLHDSLRIYQVIALKARNH
jgi:class 3 adenylate cyclase